MLNAHRIAFIASPHVDNTTAMKTNQAEAEMIAATVMQIYRSTADRFDEAQTVGIIVPYRNQIATIRSAIDAAYRTMYGDADTQQAEAQRNKLHNITIDTVERYQVATISYTASPCDSATSSTSSRTTRSRRTPCASTVSLT